MEKYEWEIATGITVLRETPFTMKWVEEKKKEAFYARHFDELEQEVYEILKILALKGKDISKYHSDYVLEMRRLRVVHRPDLHLRIMTVMQTSDPYAYNGIRLYDVTGSYTDKGGFYINEVEEIITAVFSHWIAKLQHKTDKLIRYYVEPAYKRHDTAFWREILR